MNVSVQRAAKLPEAVPASEFHNRLDELLPMIEAQANEGPTLKRIQPRAQGRAFAIHKPMTHITVVVENRES